MSGITFTHVMCVIDLLLFYLLFMELVSIPPKRKRRSGTWVQDEARGESVNVRSKRRSKRRRQVH